MQRFQSLIKSKQVGKEIVKERHNSGYLEKFLFKWKWTFKNFELPWKGHGNLASENFKKSTQKPHSLLKIVTGEGIVSPVKKFLPIWFTNQLYCL